MLNILLHAALYITEWHSFIRAAPPVPEGSSKCRTQQIHRPHVSCSPDGNYTSVQCSGGPRARCLCVDPLTGIRLVGVHSVPEREKDTLDCSDGNTRGECIAYVRSTVLCKPHLAQNTIALHWRRGRATKFASTGTRGIGMAATRALANVSTHARDACE